MTDSHIGSTESNILDYLKSLQSRSGGLDIKVEGGGRSGVLHLRQGQVVAAQCGILHGNGAFLSLAGIDPVQLSSVEAEQPVKRDVTVSAGQVERFFAKAPGLPQTESLCQEDQVLQEAIGLFFQFRRKEAGTKLVEVLRSNRFHYPAWLWHSRLMTRENHIKKGLNEAKKWGNSDPFVAKELQKIIPKLTGSSETVKRCIFCWSPVDAGEERCGCCQGMQKISKLDSVGRPGTEELHQTLSFYEEELQKNPKNLRIAYCLYLGFCSLGKIDRARGFIQDGLKVSPKEPLFVRAAKLLQPVEEPLQQQTVQQVALKKVAQQQGVAAQAAPVQETSRAAEKTVLVVEDSKTARKVVSLVLGRKGYKILEAASGTEALLAIEGVTPDLVLLDVMLPDMTGYEVLETIRKKSNLAKTPVVMLTGKRGAADRQRGMASGSNEYLTKPFDPAKLLKVIAKYLEVESAGKQASQANYIKKPETAKVEPASAPQKAVASPVPRAVKPSSAPPASPSPVAPRPPEKTTQAAKREVEEQDGAVLVVEDSPTSRKVISMVLTRKGYGVNEAATGAEALTKLAESTPKLILLDAMLPDMTGYDILAGVKKDPRLTDIPVVMLTAKDSPQDREKGMRAGSAAYLTKPFNPDKLLSVIGRYI